MNPKKDNYEDNIKPDILPGSRGCGNRQPDSIYLESRQSDYGMPLEHFLIDPPHPCYENDIPWSRSYQVFEKKGVKHLIDWVGEEHYPSVWDFIEETRKKGISRRISKDFDFSILTPGKSQIFFAHKKARFDDTRHEYGHPWKDVEPDLRTRVTMLTPKNYYPPTEDIGIDGNFMNGGRIVGDLKYLVKYDTSLDHSVDVLKEGLFMHMPITNIVYVRPSDKKMLQKIKELNIDIEIVDE